MTCGHEHTAAVDVHLPDPTDDTNTNTVTVAQICTDCWDQLPAAWGCTDCQWVEVRRFCDVVPHLILGQPCRAHAS